MAADQNLDSDDGLQKALKKLQLAAGIFLHLKESVVGAIQQDPTPDLDPETLGVLAGNVVKLAFDFTFEPWRLLR